MEKIMLHFEPDEWLAQDIENYKKEHPDLDFNKDILQNFILSLKEKVSGLEAQVRYLNDTAEKSVEGADTNSVHRDSPSDGQKPSPTQAPNSEWKPPSTDDLHMLKIRGKTYRISDTQIAKSVWKDGEATFSRSHVEHLAFLEAQGQIAAEKTREIEKSKQETDRLHTQEHQKRADITVDMHRQIVQYHKRPRPLIQEEGHFYLKSPCPLGKSPTFCRANPCDKRRECDKEHIINHGVDKYDHGGMSEQYIR